eukprot:tig00000139_g8314.t1
MKYYAGLRSAASSLASAASVCFEYASARVRRVIDPPPALAPDPVLSSQTWTALTTLLGICVCSALSVVLYLGHAPLHWAALLLAAGCLVLLRRGVGPLGRDPALAVAAFQSALAASALVLGPGPGHALAAYCAAAGVCTASLAPALWTLASTGFAALAMTAAGAPGAGPLAAAVAAAGLATSELARLCLDFDEAAKLQEVVTANVTHELRTPLMAIVGSLEVMDKASRPAPPRLTGRRGRAARAAEALVALEVEVAAACRRAFRGDASKLNQVLMNLLSNAIKFGPGGTVSLRVAPHACEAAGAGLLCGACSLADTDGGGSAQSGSGRRRRSRRRTGHGSPKSPSAAGSGDEPAPAQGGGARGGGDGLAEGERRASAHSSGGEELEGAARASPPLPGGVGCCCCAAPQRAGHSLVDLVVSDSGPGVAPGDLPRLFKRFSQLEPRPGSGAGGRPKGTGLGLAIVAGLLSKMGGHVRVSSELGRGTSFIVTVPLELDEPAADVAAAAPDAPLRRAWPRNAYASRRSPSIASTGTSFSGLSSSCTLVSSVPSASAASSASASSSASSGAVLLRAPHLRRRRFSMPPVLLGLEGPEPAPGLSSAPPLCAGFASGGLVSFFGQNALGGACASDGEIDPYAAVDAIAVSRKLSTLTIVSDVGPAPPVPSLPAGPPAPRVLVCDDDPVNRLLAERMLKSLGAAPEVAASGPQASAMYAAALRTPCAHEAPGPYRVVILDLNMPGYSGYDVARELRRLEANEGGVRAALVAWTASGGADVEPKAAAAGFDRVLRKPCRRAEFRELLEQLGALPPAPAPAPAPAPDPAPAPAHETPYSLEVILPPVPSNSPADSSPPSRERPAPAAGPSASD